MTVKDARGAWVYRQEDSERYPVQLGEIWECGGHLLAQGDLEAGAGDRLLERLGEPAGVIWTDPPWGSGNARTFRTKAAIDGPDGGRAVDWPAFQALNARLWAASGARDVWVEMGRREEAGLIGIAARAGLYLRSSTGITYYGKSPCRLLRFQPEVPAEPGIVDGDFEGMDEWHLPALCVERSVEQVGVPADSWVVDFCAGQGLVPERVAELNRDRGMALRFAGTELNPHRISVALGRLAKVTGGVPTCVGEL